MLKDRAKSANAHTTSDFAAATGRVILHLERMTMIKIAPGYASLPARSRGRKTDCRLAGRLGRIRKIASNNHQAQARRLRGRLIPINMSFPETARWKRRVPMEFL